MQQGIVNRRYLRVKAFQALYAHEAEGVDVNSGETNMMQSIDRAYDLYLYMLQMLLEMKHRAVTNIEQIKYKRIITEEDKNPGMKFVENKVAKILEQNRSFASEKAARKIDKKVDEDLMRKMWKKLKESELYKNYMNAPEHSFDEDKRFVIKLFRSEFPSSELLQDYFEEHSIYWSDDLAVVIPNIVQTIGGLEKDTAAEDVFLSPLYKDAKADPKFVKDLYRKTLLNGGELKKPIDENTTNWDYDRIAKLDTIIMKMALCEMLYFPTIPVKVTINEYIELAKDYSTPKSRSFINGVLDKISKKLQKEGKIVKSGRGLVN